MKDDNRQRSYIAIDLKSFYASAECVDMGLDPLNTNLVVADSSRTEKTICLAVSPSLKSHGISGRARLFEVVQRVKEVNAERKRKAPGRELVGSSCDARELAKNPSLALDYYVATPRMAHYMKFSTQIYDIYLRYIAPEDIHVYSIDEVFIDATPYLRTYEMTAHELAMKLVRTVLEETGITATAGVGTNLYLAKIAMDIVAKHMPADKDGVRIAELDEMSYRKLLWEHQPITDFWRVGRGIARRLASRGLYTMGDVARCSLGGKHDFYNEDLLYKLLGINAELLIDHAWGYEPVKISDIKSYRPMTNSISSGQVLQSPYPYNKARLITREMTELLALDLVSKHLVTDQVVLTIGYDVENLADPERRARYTGDVVTDHYGRRIPKHAHGTANLKMPTSSTRLIMDGMMDIFDRVVDPDLLVRRVTIVANRIRREDEIPEKPATEQLSFLIDYEEREREEAAEAEALSKERRAQEAMLMIKQKYGSNAILKGLNFEEGATSRDRNKQIGGHKA